MNQSLFLSIVYVSVLLFSMASCGGGTDADKNNNALDSGAVSVPGTTLAPKTPDLDTPLILTIPDVGSARRIFYLGAFTISNTGNDFIDGTIEFSAGDGNVCGLYRYDREVNEFNFDGLYEVTNGSESYYFRYGWENCLGTSTFRFVVWERDIKPAPGVYDFYVVDKDIPQSGTKTFSTIGDSITWYGAGGHFRGLFDRAMPEFIYTGSRTDNHGYGHEGEGGDNTQQVINRLPDIENADNYFLLIGTNDRVSETETISNIVTIVNNLLARDNNSIVYLSTLLPRTLEPDIDERNIRLNQKIRDVVDSYASVRLKLVELELNFRAIDGWENLLQDGVHPNLEGYKSIVCIITDEIMDNSSC